MTTVSMYSKSLYNSNITFENLLSYTDEINHCPTVIGTAEGENVLEALTDEI